MAMGKKMSNQLSQFSREKKVLIEKGISQPSRDQNWAITPSLPLMLTYLLPQI